MQPDVAQYCFHESVFIHVDEKDLVVATNNANPDHRSHRYLSRKGMVLRGTQRKILPFYLIQANKWIQSYGVNKVV